MRGQGAIKNVARARTPKHQINVSTINYIASYLNYITTMGRKRTFNDADLVQPD